MNNFQKQAIWLAIDFFCLGSLTAYVFYSGVINPIIEGYFTFIFVAFVIYLVVSRIL